MKYINWILVLVLVSLLTGLLYPPFIKAIPDQALNQLGSWGIEAMGSHLYTITLTPNQEDGWLLGSGNMLYRYVGGRWRFVEKPTDKIMKDVKIFSPTDAWMVGSRLDLEACPAPTPPPHNPDSLAQQTTPCGNGAIWHYDGNSWQLSPTPPMNGLYKLRMVSPTAGWAISDNQALHYDGQSWTKVTPDFPESRFRDVAVLANDDVWGLGYNGIYHYNGVSWNQVSDVRSHSFSAISMVSATEGWAVSAYQELAYYNGTTWQIIAGPVPRTGFYDVAMLSSTDGWAVGSMGAILHYDGVSWQVAASPTSSDLYALTMISAQAGWAVGRNNTLLYYNGKEWQVKKELLYPTALTGQSLNAVDFITADKGWIGGGNLDVSTDGTGAILQYDGFHWQLLQDEGIKWVHFGDMEMISANEGWAAGEEFFGQGQMYHFDGQKWQASKEFFPEAFPFNALDMVSSTDGWAVGWQASITQSGGMIIHYDGQSWTKIDNPAKGGLLDIFMLSPTDGWAVGGGEILRYDGKTWQLVKSPTTQRLASIYMVSATNGWAVGNETMLHYDGTSWQPFSPTSFSLKGVSLNDVFMLSANDGWIVGDNGLIFHYNGSQWQEVASPTGISLNAIEMLNRETGWIVGDNGLILKYTASPSVYLPMVIK